MYLSDDTKVLPFSCGLFPKSIQNPEEPKKLQPFKGFHVEVENRTRADGYVNLLLEVIPDPIARDELLL